MKNSAECGIAVRDEGDERCVGGADGSDDVDVGVRHDGSGDGECSAGWVGGSVGSGCLGGDGSGERGRDLRSGAGGCDS